MRVGVGVASVDGVRGHGVCCLSSAAANKTRTRCTEARSSDGSLR